MRKNCSAGLENLLKFEAIGQEFVNFLRSLDQFFQTVKEPFFMQSTFLTY